MVSSRTITRKELYDLVWSRPMRDVAVEFGISDVGLGKTCARYGVPKPPRGYWARVQAGQKVRQQPLSRPDETQSITIYSTTSRIPEAARQVLASSKSQRESVAEDSRDPPTPAAPFPVVDLHKSIKLTALTLRKAKPGREGSVRATDEGMHGVIVSTAQIERAVFILDGLARRLDKESLAVTPVGKAMRVAAGQDNLTFTLLEKTRREKHVPTAEELKEEEKKRKRHQTRWSRNDWNDFDLGPYERPYPEWDTIYAGDLIVQIEGYGSDGLRRRWSDGKTQKIDLMLDEIVVGIRAYLAGKKAQREHWEEQERQRQHLQRRREKARQRRERETKRLEFLTNLSDQQREAARLAEWLATPQGQNTSTNLKRMNQWVRDRLAALQSSLNSTGLEASLEKQQLFPESDSLHDPEGEPPKDPYGYY